MIFRARLGGGGRSSLFLTLPDSVLLRCNVGEVGGDLWLIAAGGRANALSMSVSLSCAVGPVDVLGVGGYFARGMMCDSASRRSTSSKYSKEKPWMAMSRDGIQNHKFVPLLVVEHARTVLELNSLHARAYLCGSYTTGSRSSVSCALLPDRDRSTGDRRTSFSKLADDA